jgi:hypothetical protein
MDGSLWCPTEGTRQMGIRDPHEVPTNSADPGVQFWHEYVDHLGPAFGKRLLVQIESIRQDASVAQEDRTQLHVCRLRGGMSNRLRLESDVIGIEAEEMFGEECSTASSFREAGVLLAVAVGSVRISTRRLNGPVLSRRLARFAAKYFSTSIFLTRLTVAPVCSVACLKSARLEQILES